MQETQTYGVFHLFCGIGGGALGFQQAEAEWRGVRGRFVTLGGVDADPLAIADFETLTGARGTVLDLFSAEDYEAFHGRRPPAGWREATPEDLRAAAGGVTPDVVFSSPPCKGFSGLLPSSAAQSAKYQALNRLTLRGIVLALEAWRHDPPALFLLENVPRITTRGADLLRQIKAILNSYGYAVREGYHDCGEIGGLGQIRRRYLLVARHQLKVPPSVHIMPKRRLRTIGEVIGPLPLPDDPAGGPMHRLPRLQWLTWVRLALIPAGRDWRALQGIEAGRYRIIPESNGQHTNKYRVQRWDAPAGTVTGSDRLGSGAPAVADPRLGYQPHRGAYRVGRWDEPATTVVGSADVRGSNGMAAVADPRYSREPRAGVLEVQAWDRPAHTVTGGRDPNGTMSSVADPRLGCRPANGAYKVLPWDRPSYTVTGSGDVHGQGAACVADPRIPADDERPDPPPIIIAEDGTWHRPLTTWELAALQGFPLWMPDGSPLVLAGRSDRRWREAIGNAVPPPAARAIAETMLITLLAASAGETWILSPYGTPVWVRPAWDQDGGYDHGVALVH